VRAALYQSLGTLAKGRSKTCVKVDGSPTVEGLIGTKAPTPFDVTWRVFYTRQHGRNVTFEITKAK